MEWADLGQAARELAVQVVEDRSSPEMILSIARGGLPRRRRPRLQRLHHERRVLHRHRRAPRGAGGAPAGPDLLEVQGRGFWWPTTSPTPATRSSSSPRAFARHGRRSHGSSSSTRSPARLSASDLHRAPDRPLDRVPVVGRGPRRRSRRRDARRLTGRAEPAGARLHCPSPGRGSSVG